MAMALNSYATRGRASAGLGDTLRIALAVIVICLIAAAPWLLGRSDLRLATEILLYLSLATLWNLLAGYVGLVSIGQQAFVGIGGYALFGLVILGGVSPLLAIPIAIILAACAAAGMAPLLFRLKGHYFTIGTWVMAEILRVAFAQVSALGGGSGTSLPIASVRSIADSRPQIEMIIYFLAAATAIVCVLGSFLLLRSRVGLALRAIRDNAEAAGSIGIGIARIKWATYVGVAAMTALVGALIFLQKIRISPDAAFSINDWTALVIFMVVMGGIGRIEGPILGVIVFFLLRENLADLGSWYLILLGLTSIVTMLFAPKGLYGLIERATGFHLFQVRRDMPEKQKFSDLNERTET